jgi:DNA-binding beta-propeller fold protein YncE
MDDDAWYQMNDLQLKKDTVLAQYIEKKQGVFIVNEGNFMFDNASLSYYIPDSMKVLNEVFLRTNGSPLGDVAQSMTIRDSLGYISLNNSSKIYVININTFEYIGKITGLTSPRNIHFISDTKAYVTDLYSKSIAIIDPQEFKITGYIDVSNSSSKFNQHPTEQIVQYENRVYTNCWSYDNKILVIDAETDALIDSVEVPLQPNSMVLDYFSKLWVLCDGGFEGNPAGNEKPALVRLDPLSLEIEKIIYFELNQQPKELCSNAMGDTLYFLNNHVYQHFVVSEDPPEKVISSPYTSNLSGGFYGLSIDPLNGNIYVADAIDQVQRGNIYRYNRSGTPIDTFKTGISPGAFCFTQK